VLVVVNLLLHFCGLSLKKIFFFDKSSILDWLFVWRLYDIAVRFQPNLLRIYLTIPNANSVSLVKMSQTTKKFFIQTHNFRPIVHMTAIW